MGVVPSKTRQQEAAGTFKPYKQVGCLDVEPSLHCGFEVRAETEAELFKLVWVHAKHVHGLDLVPDELAAKAQRAMKTVSVDVG